ncbi:hypothetical protein [Kineosporia sp. R_H_3]|uniref:hypothetical protein n=1 Tax=Kineosporia sp. R_H_3 TaxID=1961848 RepID=UPI0018E9615B|nr:hypothetical protein [Kineosporia sp. R_H_3]
MLLARRSRHDRVAATLAALRDDELAGLVQAAPPVGVGVGGGCSSADVDGVPVFVKRVPITDRELAHPHDTSNLFDLPVAWQYGMYRLAAPGFGAWRELAANQSVTDGVLAGETESFALLHHWRVLPGRPSVATEHLDIDAVVDQFGGHRAVRARFDALASATASLVLFLEHLPDGLSGWLSDPIGRAAAVEQHLFEMVSFLRHREVLHLDRHFGNVRADDDRLYLVDFGLATSPRFDLSAAERDFAARTPPMTATTRLCGWSTGWSRQSAGCPYRPRAMPSPATSSCTGARPATSHRTCRRTWRRSSRGMPPPQPG